MPRSILEEEAAVVEDTPEVGAAAVGATAEEVATQVVTVGAAEEEEATVAAVAAEVGTAAVADVEVMDFLERAVLKTGEDSALQLRLPKILNIPWNSCITPRFWPYLAH